jgi:hypothetical protein
MRCNEFDISDGELRICQNRMSGGVLVGAEGFESPTLCSKAWLRREQSSNLDQRRPTHSLLVIAGIK